MPISDLLKKYIYPVATLSGTIIGVGFFSLPYIAMKVGIWLMLLYFLVLGALVILIHVIFGEIALKTPDFKRFPGFVGFYFGKWWKRLSLVSTISGSVGVLLVYLIIGSGFLTSVLQPILGGSYLLYIFIYFIAASFFVYSGIKAISRVELGAMIFLFLVLLFIFIKGFFKLELSNLFVGGTNLGIKDLFLPYGAIIFSLWGTGIIPEIEEMLGRNKKLIKRTIITAILISALVYLVFTLLILAMAGDKTTESALVGLKNVLGNGAASIAIFLGVVTTFIAFITMGLTLKKIFIYDMGVKNLQAWTIACFTPLVLFLLGLNSFIPLISFIGGFLLGIDGILILLMYKKTGGKKIIIYPLSLVFLLGIVYEIVYFI